MENKACSPYPGGRMIRSIAEESAVLTDVIQRQVELGKNVKPREGYKAQMARRATDRLRNMLAIPMDKVIDWMASEGAFDVKTLKNGEKVVINKKGDPEDLGEWASVMHTYLLGIAGGVRQLSDAFVLKAKAGEATLDQGLQLVKQLSYMGTIGESALGYKQSIGRGLMNQRWATEGGFSAKELREKAAAQMSAGSDQAAVQGAAEYSDKIAGIISKLNDPNQLDAGMDELLQVASSVKFMNDPMNIVKGTTGLKMVGGAWNEFVINSMLSNPSTWVTNALATVWAPMRMGAQLFGAGLMQGAAAAGVVDQKLARGVWEMSMAQMMSIRSSWRDASIMAWQAMATGRSVYWDEGSIGATRAISGENFEQLMQQKFKMERVGDGYKDAITWTGRAIRFPSRMLTTADEFAKIVSQRGEVAQRAVKRAIDDGVDLNDKKLLRQYMDEEAKAAFELGPETRFGTAQYGKLNTVYDKQSAFQEGFGNRTVSRVGDEATFQEKDGTTAAGIARTITAVLDNPVGGVLRPFLPFVRTPMNIIGQGLSEATPLGPMKTLLWSAAENRMSPTGIVADMQQKMLMSPTETARISGQIALMTTTGAVLIGMAMDGEATGGGPSRWAQQRGPQARKAQEVWEQNNTPYSFKLGGGNVIPFSKFPEPAATLMRIYSDLGGAYAYMTQEERDEAFGTLTSVAVTGLYNSSMLTGFDRFMRMVRDGDSFDAELAKNVQYWVATQTPMAGLASYVNQIDDPYARAYQTTNMKYIFSFEDIFGKGVLGRVAQRFPGGGGVQPTQIDQLYGEGVPVTPGVGPGGMNPTLQAIPFLPRKAAKDEAWQAVWDIAGTWTDYKPSNVELTLVEQQELNARMGKLRINGLTLSQAIMKLRRRPEIDQLVRERGAAMADTGMEAAAELSRLKSRYGRAAWAELQGSSVGLQQRAALASQLGELQKQNNLAGASTVSQQLNNLLKIAEMEQ